MMVWSRDQIGGETMHASMFNNIPEFDDVLKGCGCFMAFMALVFLGVGMLIGRYCF